MDIASVNFFVTTLPHSFLIFLATALLPLNLEFVLTSTRSGKVVMASPIFSPCSYPHVLQENSTSVFILSYPFHGFVRIIFTGFIVCCLTRAGAPIAMYEFWNYLYAWTDQCFSNFRILILPRRKGGGLMATALVSGRAVRVRALAGDISLCSWVRHFTLTVLLSTQVQKLVPANSMLRGSPAMD